MEIQLSNLKLCNYNSEKFEHKDFLLEMEGDSKSSYIHDIKNRLLQSCTNNNVVFNKGYIVSVNDKKASLNAPLLSCLFENENVKYIVHINHEYDNSLVSYKYAFPGTLKDSKRDNSKSFNIENHGVFYLFDEEGEIIR